MNTRLVFSITSILALASLAGCAGNSPKTESGIPAWVMTPTLSDPEAMAGVACSLDSGNLTADRQAAIAFARKEIAQNISLSAKSMDEAYARQAGTSVGGVGGTNFEGGARLIGETPLNGSRATKADYVDINGKRNLCVVVELSIKQKELFDKIVAASSKQLDEKERAALYEQYRAENYMNKMNKEFLEKK